MISHSASSIPLKNDLVDQMTESSHQELIDRMEERRSYHENRRQLAEAVEADDGPSADAADSWGARNDEESAPSIPTKVPLQRTIVLHPPIVGTPINAGPTSTLVLPDALKPDMLALYAGKASLGDRFVVTRWRSLAPIYQALRSQGASSEDFRTWALAIYETCIAISEPVLTVLQWEVDPYLDGAAPPIDTHSKDASSLQSLVSEKASQSQADVELSSASDITVPKSSSGLAKPAGKFDDGKEDRKNSMKENNTMGGAKNGGGWEVQAAASDKW